MIKDNLKQVHENINKVCQKLGRKPEEITLISVSKTKPCEDILSAYEAGERFFGENKPQEIRDKAPVLPPDIDWHMIGHLQRNKVKYVVENCVMVHSLDSLRLANKIQAECEKKDKEIDVLIEVNMARDKNKYGFMAEDVLDFIQSIAPLSRLHIKGLMTIAPYVDDPEENRPIFKQMKELMVDIARKNIDNVSMYVLSMGMTNDYQVAIEEGATHVRVGTGIFGKRNYTK